MTLLVNAGPQHATLAVDPCVDNQKVVVSRKAMLVDQMTPPLLPVATNFLAAFHKASERFIATLALREDNRIVVFRDVQLQESSRGEIGLALGTAIAVTLRVVRFVLGIG